jgi:hypothetical protein
MGAGPRMRASSSTGALGVPVPQLRPWTHPSPDMLAQLAARRLVWAGVVSVPPGAMRAGASAAQPRGNGCTSLTLCCDAFCDVALQILLEEGQYAKR